MEVSNFPPLESLLKQRPPFLFVDELISFDPEKKILLAKKTFSGDEPFYQGHFPGYPLTPGVLLCESLFQAGSILLSLMDQNPDLPDALGVVSKIEQTRFRQMVLPGDEMILQVELIDRVDKAFYLKGQISVQGKKAVQTQFVCTLTPSRKM